MGLFFSVVPAADAGGVGEFVHTEVDGVGVVLAGFPEGAEGLDDFGLGDPVGGAVADVVCDFEGGGAGLRDDVELFADVLGGAGGYVDTVGAAGVIDHVAEVVVACAPLVLFLGVVVAFAGESDHLYFLESHVHAVGEGVQHAELDAGEDVVEAEDGDTVVVVVVRRAGEEDVGVAGGAVEVLELQAVVGGELDGEVGRPTCLEVEGFVRPFVGGCPSVGGVADLLGVDVGLAGGLGGRPYFEAALLRERYGFHSPRVVSDQRPEGNA